MRQVKELFLLLILIALTIWFFNSCAPKINQPKKSAYVSQD